MAPGTGLIRRRVVAVTMVLWLGCNQAAAVRDQAFNRVSSNAQLSVPEVGATTEAPNNNGLTGGAVAGIVVGSVLGGLILVVILGLLIRYLCQRRIVSSHQDKPGSTSVLGTKTPGSSVWNFFRKRDLAPRGSKRVPPPIFGSDKLEPDDISDTSFVLPELGGPNPHNKFDGMEWVDIKGMDDDALVAISTDLRKYQQRQ